MNESLFRTLVRTFFTAFAKVAGFLLAFILIMLAINSFQEGTDSIPNNYDVEILPNAQGVRKEQSKSAPVILQLNIHGVIGAEGLEQKDIESLLVESRENSLKSDRVKAILLSINSPGGGATDADGIYRALLTYKERYKVPVIAYVDGLCASGGMYIACAADEIYASEVSMVGSVGVITSAFLNVSKTMDKIGVESLTLYAGKGKDDLNPLRPWKEGESNNFKEIIEATYKNFVDIVTSHRPALSKEKLVQELGANVYIAEKAKELGYIDGIVSGRDEALKIVLAKLSIEDDYYQVVKLDSTNWINQLFRSESPLLTGKIRHELFAEDVPLRLKNQPLYLYRP